MQVTFLSSPFFSYVYTFVLDTEALNPSVYSHATQPAQLAQPILMTNVEARPSSINRDPLFTRLASWVDQLTKEVVC
jgi:hypothetical protein